MADYSFRTNLEEENKTPTGPVKDNPQFSAPKIEKQSKFKTFLEGEVDRNIQRDLGLSALQAYKDNDADKFYKAVADRGKDQLKYTAGSLAAIYGAPLAIKVLRNPFVDTVLTIDGVRNNITSNNGWRKTWREYKAGNYGKAALSGTFDLLDGVGATGITAKVMKGGINFTKNFMLPYLRGDITRKIPINPTLTYRQVTTSAITDANKSGVIRANPNSKDPFGKQMHWAGASFTKGRLYNPRDKVSNNIIVGESSLEWVAKNPHVQISDFNLDQARKMPIELGSEVTPVFNNNINNAPINYFHYWERENGLIGKHFWKKKSFK